MIDHTTHVFDTDLQELARKVSDMGRLDDEQVADATQALIKRDTVLAARVISVDDRIDTLQRDIEAKVIATIARRQPVAVDLRQIMAALHISIDLERVGDFAENIAKRVMLLADDAHINESMLQFQRMAHLARKQLARVLESYARRDTAQALDVWRSDEEIDALNSSLFRELLTYMMENPRNITFCTHMLFCTKNIERIGDHATNIAETVFYMVEGRPLCDERPKADITSRKSAPPAA